MRVGPPRPVLDHLPGANNNLDAIGHDGRLWLATRTAPVHFASSAARLLVCWSEDEGATWALDHTIAPGRDVREPRLVVWQGRLLLYWFTAGTRTLAFEPDRIHVSERVDGRWTEPVAISPPDCVVWRVRPVGDRLLMTLYRGAGSLYTAHPVPLTVELWASTDGVTWAPADPDRPVVHRGGAEAEFVEVPDGRLVVVVRKEGEVAAGEADRGDDVPGGGWGSDVGTAPAGAPARWEVRPDSRKFDSPYLFLDDDGTPYLVARRQLAFGGRYDVAPDRLPPRWRTKVDQGLYSLTPKRTGVFRIDPDAGTATWVGDLPSAGDTAFAGSVPLGAGRHLVFNYTSRVDRPWWPWALGQVRPTSIYSVVVSDLGST